MTSAAAITSVAFADAYRDASTGLTFDPPAGWTQEPPMGDAASTLVRFVRPADSAGAPQCVFAIGTTERSPKLPADSVQFLDAAVRGIRWHSAQPPTNGRLGPVVDTTVGGLAAKTMTMDAESKIGPTRVHYWFVIVNDRIVSFAYGAPEPLHAAHLAEAEASIASVHSGVAASQASTRP